MIRRFLLSALVLFAALAIPGSAAPPEANAQQAVTIRIATLAPRGSTWMRVFNAWNADLRRRTQNQVSIRFYPGGVSGDERDFIRKINAGQMDGAAVTTTGLGQVVRPILVLGVPGIIEEYRQIDRVREQMRTEFNTMFEGAGYVNLGWGDVGKARLFSQAPIRRPQDMRSMRPWAWRDDMIFTEFLRVIGANGVRLGVPEVYPALQTGQVNVVPASALAAVSLQWHTRLTHVTQQNSGVIVGATIVKKSIYDGLTADQQTALRETSQRAHDLLMRSIRRDDDRAYATILERGTTQIDTSPAQADWDRAAEQTRQRLTGRVYPADLLQRVMAAAGN